MPSVAGLFAQLYAKDNALASRSLRELEARSVANDDVYACLPQMAAMLEDRSAYVRMRAVTLLAANARWDAADQLPALMPRYLAHIADQKPTVARQCIRRLPEIVRCKPALAPMAAAALRNADISAYPGSMRALVAGDIDGALRQLEQLQST